MENNQNRSAEEQKVNVAEETAVLVGISRDADFAEQTDEQLSELRALAETAKLTVAAELVQIREKPDAATCLGSGKLRELSELCSALSADLVVFDCELSPTQIKNIEDALQTETRVIDRTVLILDIFAASAKTSEGMLQVEIAQLKYDIPRLTGRGKSLSRLGGGIGTRGPGESQLESDRRHARRRIAALEKKLTALRASRDLRRRARKSGGIPQITIAGYTNAGKSTLLNALTGAGVLAQDKLFATLDPTTRRLKLPHGNEVLFTDTVGFIDRLPHHLIEAFASTLDEVAYADLLLVVYDAADANLERQTEVTRALLAELYESRGVCAPPTIFVYNKCDLASARQGVLPTIEETNHVFLSAKTGDGLERLFDLIERLISSGRQTLRFVFDAKEASILDVLYRTSIVREVEYEGDLILVTASVDDKIRGRFAAYIR